MLSYIRNVNNLFYASTHFLEKVLYLEGMWAKGLRLLFLSGRFWIVYIDEQVLTEPTLLKKQRQQKQQNRQMEADVISGRGENPWGSREFLESVS